MKLYAIRKLYVLAACTALSCVSAGAQAANINIDYASNNTFSFYSGAFEMGFSASSYGTGIPDGTVVTFSGTWESLHSLSGSNQLVFAYASSPNTIFGEMDYTLSGGSYYSTITGTFWSVGSGHTWSTTATKVLTDSSGSANTGLAPYLGAEVTPTASPAPEPASWAMMIAGFGGIGGVMRRRQRAGIRFA